MTVEAPPAPTDAEVLAQWDSVAGRRVVDLFAGPGGWDLAAVALGLEVLGVEWDDSACATRRAAGLRTLQADVAALVVALFGPVEGLIGSPPCPTFSRAGTGSGKHLMDVIVECMRALVRGEDARQDARDAAYAVLLPIVWEAERAAAKKKGREPDRAKAEAKARRDADMSVLVVEPLRWALALESVWITLEQVPDVLGLWQVMGDLLRSVGYSVWTGILEAERYGVAQTRERAVLIARRDGKPAHPPVATHQRYVPGVPRLEHPELTLEGEVRPWVSMADAIAYGMTCRPGFTVRAGKSPLEVMDGGAAAREAILKAEASGEWRQRSNYERPVDAPAPTVDGQGTWKVGEEHAEPPMSWKDDADDEAEISDGACGDPLGLKGEDWPERRPATTLAGDARVSQPGGHHGTGEQSKFAVRVTVAEAGILQSFPADYPWQGDPAKPNLVGKQYQCVGNAIPPLLALRVLEAATDAVPLA